MAHTARRNLALAVSLGIFSAVACTGSTGNHDPQLTTLDAVQIKVGQRKQMVVRAADEDNDDLEFFFQITLFSGDPAKTIAYSDAASLERGMKWIAGGTEAVFEWGPSPNHVGEHTLTVVVDDGEGGRAEATGAITVLAGEEQGAPRFDFHPNLVLDLVRSDCLKARVRVDDPDSIEVNITLEGAPEGMELKTTVDTGKEAEITWCPDREQLGEKNVHTFFAVADDGEHEPVRQRMSVVIKRAGGGGAGGGDGPAPGCSGTVPIIDFAPIADQSGPGDYVLEAIIRDNESEIVDAFAAFSTSEDPSDNAGYRSVGMVSTGAENFIGSIPSVAWLAEEALADDVEGNELDLTKPIRFYYYLCAWDNDDAAGEQCDNAVCEPNQSQFTFVWTPAGGAGGGDSGCPDDDHDDGAGNDSQATAAGIAEGEGFSLVLCPGDEDWYSVTVEQGDTLVVGVGYSAEGGDLAVKVFAPDGSPAGSAREDNDAGFELVEVTDAVGGDYVVQITGTDIGTGGEVYNLIIRREAGGGANAGDCPVDAGEPNNAVGNATAIEPGSSGPYGMCGAGDPEDWFVFNADAGAAIELDLQFAHRNDGDLDLELWPPGGERRVAHALSATDNEHIEFTANASGAWNVRVVGYRGAINTYRLVLAVGGAQGGGGGGVDPVCSSDGGAEPNDDSGAARVLDGPVACAAVQGEDEDWWRINLQAGEGFTAELGFIHADGDVDVFLYAANGTTQLIKSDSSSDNETVLFPGTLVAGPVFLKVIGFEGAANTYSIALNKRSFGPGASCMADRLEPNDAREDAKALFFRQEFIDGDALSWCAGNDDWYRFFIPNGNSLLGEVSFGADQAVLNAEVFDREGVAIEGAVTSPGPGRLDIELNASGDRYLRIYGADGEGDAALYRLELELVVVI